MSLGTVFGPQVPYRSLGIEGWRTSEARGRVPAEFTCAVTVSEGEIPSSQKSRSAPHMCQVDPPVHAWSRRSTAVVFHFHFSSRAVYTLRFL